MPGHLEIAKVGEDTHEIRLSGHEEDGKCRLDYELWFSARNASNLNFDDPEWPPEEKDGEFHIGRGSAWGGLEDPADSCEAYDLTSVRLKRYIRPAVGNSCKSFHVYYVDETAKEPKRRTLAKKRTDYKLWRGPLGIEPRLRPAFVHNGLAFIRQMIEQVGS